MKKPGGMKGHKGMKPAAPPMAGGAVAGPMGAKAPAGGSGAMPLSAPKSLKAFGHPMQEVKPLTTDRGSFKIKG